MTAQIWPFKPRAEMLEVLQWNTDVLASRDAEQRICLATAPGRTFQLSHLMSDYLYSAGRAMIRASQGADGFLVPDWGQLVQLGPVSPASEYTVEVDLSYIDMGERAILWESPDNFEQVEVISDSNGVTLGSVVNNYDNARLMPLWAGIAPEGLLNSRGPARVNEVSIAMELTESNDLGASTYDQYRDHDIMPDCPIVGDSQFDESIAWPVSRFHNGQNAPHLIRQRDRPDVSFQMRWHAFQRADAWTLRRWIHSRRGRQKVFWMSSRGLDFEPAAAIAGTTVTVFDLPGVAQLGRDQVFDIDITSWAGVSQYRRVTATTAGSNVSGRTTVDMTIDSSLNIALADIKRISVLRCTRFDADQIVLRHRAAAGMDVQIPCVEVAEP